MKKRQKFNHSKLVSQCDLFTDRFYCCCSQGYEVHVFDSVTNQTVYLGNTTETYFRISSLLVGHNYTFSVQARCLLGGQLCGEPALLLYNQQTGTGDPLEPPGKGYRTD